MKRILSMVCVLAALTWPALATETLLDAMTDINYTTAARAGETITLSTVSGALQISYDYLNADPWYISSAIEKTFAAPVDLSAMEYMTLDLNVPTANAGFMLILYFTDEQGYQTRFLSYPAFSAATTGFKTLIWRLSDLQNSRWAASGRPVNLKKITKVNYNISNQGIVTAGNFTYQLDNLKVFSAVGLINEVVVDDFESYGDNAALQAVWVPAFSGMKSTLLETVAPFEGSKSLALTADLANKWTNYGVIRTYAQPQDFSGARYFKLSVYGNALLTGLTPTPHVYLEDVTGARAMAYMWNWAAFAEWQVMYLSFASTGIEGYVDSGWTLASGGNSIWREDRWDGGTWDQTTDLTQIRKVILSFETQGDTTWPLNDVTLKFDSLIAGMSTTAPPVASVKNYTANAVTTYGKIVVDGTASSGEWSDAAAAMTGFVAHDNPATPAAEDLQVQAAFDANYLYLLMQKTDANFALDFTPTGGVRDPAGTGFAGDDFEVFLTPGTNMGDDYYHIVFFPNQADGICYIWDELTAGGPTSWNGTGDQAAFTYNGATRLLTLEYRIPWTAFSAGVLPVAGTPASGALWGVQIGYINNNPAEAVNWEPDTTAGFAAGRPFGTWHFAGTPAGATSARSWTLYQ